jgi:hypothetical protein
MVVDGDLAYAQGKCYLLIGILISEAQGHNLFSDGRFEPLDEFGKMTDKMVFRHQTDTLLIVEKQPLYTLTHILVGDDVAASVAHSLHQIAGLTLRQEYDGVGKQLLEHLAHHVLVLGIVQENAFGQMIHLLVMCPEERFDVCSVIFHLLLLQFSLTKN